MHPNTLQPPLTSEIIEGSEGYERSLTRLRAARKGVE
jgi:hypothetical protein